MQSFVVYSTLVKLVLLLNLPINCPLITLAILCETPYSISSRFIGWRDVVSLIFCALSCLVNAELIPESHFLYNFTISMSWLWLIIDCLYENLQFFRQYPNHSSSHPTVARRVKEGKPDEWPSVELYKLKSVLSAKAPKFLLSTWFTTPSVIIKKTGTQAW